MIRHSCWLVTDVPVCLALSTHESRGSWLMRSWLCLCDHESRGSWLMRSWLCLCDHESRGSWLMRSWLCLCDHEVVSHDSWGHVSQYSWESWVTTHVSRGSWLMRSWLCLCDHESCWSWLMRSWVMTHEVMWVITHESRGSWLMRVVGHDSWGHDCVCVIMRVVGHASFSSAWICCLLFFFPLSAWWAVSARLLYVQFWSWVHREALCVHDQWNTLV